MLTIRGEVGMESGSDRVPTVKAVLASKSLTKSLRGASKLSHTTYLHQQRM